jgi:hypothetical protein
MENDQRDEDEKHLSQLTSAPRRTGFLVGSFTVPEDFDRMGITEIEELFVLED